MLFRSRFSWYLPCLSPWTDVVSSSSARDLLLPDGNRISAFSVASTAIAAAQWSSSQVRGSVTSDQSLAHSHSRSLSLTLTQAHSFSLALAHSRSRTLSLTLTHAHSHSRTLTHTHTQRQTDRQTGFSCACPSLPGTAGLRRSVRVQLPAGGLRSPRTGEGTQSSSHDRIETVLSTVQGSMSPRQLL